MLTSARKRVCIMRVLLTVFLIFASSRAYSSEWVRFSAARPRDLPGVPFGLLSTQEGQKTGLSADGWYRYIEGRAPVTLHGKREADKTFRPRVTYQVAVEGKTKWKEIRADIEQPSSETISVDPDHPGVGVIINMEPFRASIGVYRYGRLVLENGDATIFVIDDLLPTLDETENGDGDFKIEIEKEKRTEGFIDEWLAEPATLVAVTSIGGRIIGDFVYSNRTSETVRLSGFRTLDGDFWPTSVLQAAEADGTWRPIGQSNDNGTASTLEIATGKAERVRIFLSEFRPLIGRYRFGKTVFSNGSAGVFPLEALKGQNPLPTRQKEAE